MTSTPKTARCSGVIKSSHSHCDIQAAATSRRRRLSGLLRSARPSKTLLEEEIKFIDENGGGAGVRLKKPHRAAKRK